MFTKFNLRPYYSSQNSLCQRGLVEFCELCRYAQNSRGDIVFYDRFVYLCKQKGVTPTRAAIDAGISKSLVTKWKTNNVNDPSPDVLRRLSAYFNVPISELLGEEEKEKSPDQLVLTEGEEMLLNLFRQVPAEQQALVLQMIRAALNSQK